MDKKLDNIKTCIAAIIAKELTPHVLQSSTPARVTIPHVNPQVTTPTCVTAVSQGILLVNPIMQGINCTSAAQVSQTMFITSPMTPPVDSLSSTSSVPHVPVDVHLSVAETMQSSEINVDALFLKKRANFCDRIDKNV